MSLLGCRCGSCAPILIVVHTATYPRLFLFAIVSSATDERFNGEKSSPGWGATTEATFKHLGGASWIPQRHSLAWELMGPPLPRPDFMPFVTGFKRQARIPVVVYYVAIAHGSGRDQ